MEQLLTNDHQQIWLTLVLGHLSVEVSVEIFSKEDDVRLDYASLALRAHGHTLNETDE